jgi:DNA-binding NtrC family response regulator
VEPGGVLYVDDEQSNLDAFLRCFDEEFRVLTALSREVALQRLESEAVAVVLSDQRMPGITGVKLLTETAARWPLVGRMLLAGYSDRGLLLEAIQDGHVHDYILKPWSRDDLAIRLRNGLQRHQRLQSLERPCLERDLLRAELEEQPPFDETIGIAGGLRALGERIDRVANSSSTVLIRGESGVGKELVARAIHARSPRADRAFVRVNCAAFAEGVLESELFGHEAGAFTGAKAARVGRFEQAHGGTLFLDEIGDISLNLQTKLLRVLQERELERVGGNRTIPVDIRLVVATHRNLEEMVAAGQLRSDLYYRINVVPLVVPPLRARADDIPFLANHFLARFALEMGKRLELAPGALGVFCNYDWPGNVRELRNVIERAAVLADPEQVLTADDLILDVLPAARGSVLGEIQNSERDKLIASLQQTSGNKAAAARLLGIPRTTLNERLRKYDIR